MTHRPCDFSKFLRWILYLHEFTTGILYWQKVVLYWHEVSTYLIWFEKWIYNFTTWFRCSRAWI
jgi:phosphoglycerol transferase MdoB-like AlkP superfamily enzyme